MSEDVAPSPVVRPAPDPERDARVAARRAADRRRATIALDRFIASCFHDLRLHRPDCYDDCRCKTGNRE